jgi:hypothetical protein
VSTKIGVTSQAPKSDDFDLSIEKVVCPEVNSAWWPVAVPTDGPAPAP